MGPIPGCFANLNKKKMYSDFITPTFKNYLQVNGLQSAVKGNTNTCLNTTLCRNLLIAGAKFMTKMNIIFPPINNSKSDIMLQRPDYYLGRIFAMFADKVSQTNFELEESTNMGLNSTFQIQILDLINFYFNPEMIGEGIIQKAPWCIYSANSILSKLFDTFLDINKHSMVGTTARTEAQLNDFEQKYINGSAFLGTQKIERPKYLENMPGIIPFCEVAPKLALYDMPTEKLSTCDYFNLSATPKGICYSFNSQSLNEIYKESNISDYWISVFEQQNHQTLINPSGYGPSNGLNFVLNSFEHYFKDSLSGASKIERLSQNFILSISNEFNPYDVYKQNYFIEPGNIYTYRILANQITTSERFEDMEPASRNCSLPKESKNLNFTKSYTKSACEYECAVENAKQECSMSPWYIPRLAADNQPFSSNWDTKCFDDAIAKFSTSQCNCPSDCFGTSFSVFESRIPIDNFYCTDTQRKLKEYPYSVLCNLCDQIRKTHYLGFLHYFIVNGGPDPSKYGSFCNSLLGENVAIVKVEMATKSLTRSLKDKRFNFVSQLSSLGKP